MDNVTHNVNGSVLICFFLKKHIIQTIMYYGKKKIVTE